MPQPLSLYNFILVSVILHVALIALLLFQSKNKDNISLQFETQVFFQKEDNSQKIVKKTPNYKKARETPKITGVRPSPDNRGLLKANKTLVKQDLNLVKQDLNLVPSTIENQTRGSGLENFSKKWRRKNQLNSYKAVLSKIVSENWILPPVNNKNFQILIETIIRSDGSIAQINFLSKTGMAVLDTAALKSIQVSVPFPKFQKFNLIEKKNIRIVFRFTPEKIDN